MLFISVPTEDNMSFVLSSWHQGIEPWDFNLAMGSAASTHIAHTVFDRMLLRAGETVHMKHILRKHTMAGFVPADTPVLPAKLMITHAGSGQRYELPLKLDSEGWAANDWTIPKEAKYGVYQVTLTKARPASTAVPSGSRRSGYRP
jgi:alpha-2-macroglobulin